MPARARVSSGFHDIREWDGSNHRAFEELCFQLRDPTPADVELIKTGDPDAGVEWYWRHDNGTETGWQAKFIFTTDELLKAMRASLKTAAEKRPGLRKVTFCIPYDLADDPSRARGKQARERFDEAKVRWKRTWPEVEVGLLSGGELLDRLAREEHRGREWFFFNERILGREWCKRELAGTVEDAGDRYTPQHDVDLPIDHILEAVAQPRELETELQKRRDAALSAGRDLLKKTPTAARWGAPLAAIERALAALEHDHVVVEQPPQLRLEATIQHVRDAEELLDDLAVALRPVAWPEELDLDRRQTLTDAQRTALAETQRQASLAQSLWPRCRDVQSGLHGLLTFLTGPACQAAERHALFVEGPAGRGKTHLFCDVGERLLSQDHPVVVLLGQRFLDASPWTTLARVLGDPSLAPDEIATILAASGQASGRRALLFIDALNDARDPTMWAAELADMRRRLTATGWVGLAVSCRSTYLDLVEPESGPDDAFARVEHLGYRGREFEATAKIFAAHGIQEPRVPLLLPEFNNPLFLKLYCDGIKDQTAPTTGTDHLTAVFERFANGRKARVERQLQLDLHRDIVGQALTAFAQRLGAEQTEQLPYETAHALINEFAPHLHSSPNTLLEAMASEGLLAVERGWIAQREHSETVVSFPYQRFSDHLVLNALLDQQPHMQKRRDVLDAFGGNQPLGRWLVDAPGGLIEALAIQLPERWRVELPDLYESPVDNDYRAGWAVERAWDAFIASVVVRDRNAFTDRTHDLINEALNLDPRQMADALISVAPDPDHPYNGKRLRAFLVGIPLADRDAYWTRMLYDDFGDPSRALDRLTRWAARGPYPAYPEQVVALACVPLIWQLASPNRFARDYTTKALATLLMDRPTLSARLVEEFAEVDDPYVTQRLAAAILGAVTRANSPPSGATARHLLDTLLTLLVERDGAPPDLLTRDLIASLARWLRRRRLIPRRTLRRASPPYGSRPPKTPRRAAYLKATYRRSQERDEDYGSLQYSALSTHSDWARYVASGRADDFLKVKLGEPVPKREEREAKVQINERAWRRFLTSLSPEQTSLLSTDDETDAGAFLDSLDDNQRALLDKSYRLRGPKWQSRPLAFPPERAARFIFQRCIELGWTPERFAGFDATIARRDRGRASHKPERFGKKYQWIALFELLGRLADNYTMHGWDGARLYEGAWQLNLRDIDPTIPPERIEVADDQEHVHSPTFPLDATPAWWSPTPPTFDDLEPGQEGVWAQRQEDLPTPEALLIVTDPDGARWVIVNGYHNWRDDPDDAPSVTTDPGPDRDVAILTGAAIIRRRDLPRFQRWLEEHPDLLRALPDWHAQGIYEAFWSELPDECQAHDYPAGWRRGGCYGLPVSSGAVSLGYAAEDSARDCSLTSDVHLEIPSKLLADLACLERDENDNVWIEPTGHVFAQYRETDEGFYRDRVLMISEPRLTAILRQNDLVLAVGVFSERRVFDRTRSSFPNRLGWVDYAGHLLVDGGQRISRKLQPLDDHNAG
jgi:hypothetical protein